ncbi:hypothetical protein FHJ31_01970 [Pseudomonas sp. Fig-3]|nr:hypothetical protein FHJ31_01970 [Pseudomonas sp. Fig-3]
MADFHSASILNVPPLSRASSLPQGLAQAWQSSFGIQLAPSPASPGRKRTCFTPTSPHSTPSPWYSIPSSTKACPVMHC